MSQMTQDSVRRFCPNCRSDRLHHSHRRGSLERFLSSVGAHIRRCHVCRSRQAWWGAAAIPLVEQGGGTGRRSSATMICTGLLLCLIFLWYLITH